MLFINTRPIDRAQPLTECLRQSGFDVVDLPLLELTPRPYNNILQQLYLQLLSTQIIVVVSPTAVQVGMQYLQQSGLSLLQIKHIQWIAVGKKTAQRLSDYGVESHVPMVETSEGMLSLPLFNTLKDLKKIAFWRGEGGRQFMMQQCQDRHIDVLNFVLYDRACPPETHQRFLDFVARVDQFEPPYWSCISSEASWNNWLVLTRDHQEIVSACHYLVLGERLYQLLRHDKNATQTCLNSTKILNLEPETILQTIVQLQRKL
ncbi:uroporphyrinogen-III synthase [Acinetobacter sp. ULE_I057]|uniref:uroporphyrinogen-III synthase n=1 Tax=Acinetobacter sp. ULE_I057 TaxID=3373070 RepID=UPI003AF6335C